MNYEFHFELNLVKTGEKTGSDVLIFLELDLHSNLIVIYRFENAIFTNFIHRIKEKQKLKFS